MTDVYSLTGLGMMLFGVVLHVTWTDYRDGDVCHAFLPIIDIPNIISAGFVICGLCISSLAGAP
jgi:hypothetical protein